MQTFRSREQTHMHTHITREKQQQQQRQSCCRIRHHDDSDDHPTIPPSMPTCTSEIIHYWHVAMRAGVRPSTLYIA